MYTQKISIKINSDFDRNQIQDEFENLLSCYYRMGQIQGEYEEPFGDKDSIFSCVKTLEKSSLSTKYNEEEASNSIKNLEQWCKSKMKIKLLGTSIYDNSTCACKRSDFYILFTHNFLNSSPLICGGCMKRIPIYKIKNLNSGDRYHIKHWETDYLACDDLQTNCRVGETWAMRQMSDPRSQLSMEGIEICHQVRDRTGVLVYYYLFNYRNITIEQDKSRKCPSCKGEWLLPEKLDDFFDFKCDSCFLVSSITSNAKAEK